MHHPPNAQLAIPDIARFRRRSDAEAHLQVLRRLIPNVTYQIIFDVPLERTDLTPDCRSPILGTRHQ
ncbi:hypothetical protein [Microseira wollei]|uniref:hypothetical protein n=1 Tax=Microseira wollei TaxID=467598 RepID=UPI0027D95CBC|nr:hypothetical protein [Microseira wollei]